MPWQYRVGKPDLDHFNRDFLPEQARGGSQICELDVASGLVKELTGAEAGTWDFRGRPSPDGKLIAFCRARTGKAPELCLLNRATGQVQTVTQGIDGLGADHPRWV